METQTQVKTSPLSVNLSGLPTLLTISSCE